MKRIKNFDAVCKKIGIPLILIKNLERSLKKFSGKIYIVGGSVRDLILNQRSQNNPDLVVNLELSKLLECLDKSKIKYLDIGVEYGSIVVFLEKFKFDLTVMRSDIKTDGRWAKVKFTNNLAKDSKRRDFTFNSVYCDTDGNLNDPNHGIKDLLNKRVKFIGNVNERIKEDYLRILRFVRFSLEISNSIDAEIFSICSKYLKKLSFLSFERRIQETERILSNKNLGKSEVVLSIAKLLEYTFETKLNFKNFSKLCAFESAIGETSFERRIKFLLRNKRIIPQFFKKNASNSLKKRLEIKINFKNFKEKELNIMLLKFDNLYIVDQLIFGYIDNIIPKAMFHQYYDKTVCFKRKKVPLNGNDLLKIGFKPGKDIGKILKRLELFWGENNFRCTKADCIKYVQKFLP